MSVVGDGSQVESSSRSIRCVFGAGLLEESCCCSWLEIRDEWGELVARWVQGIMGGGQQQESDEENGKGNKLMKGN